MYVIISTGGMSLVDCFPAFFWPLPCLFTLELLLAFGAFVCGFVGRPMLREHAQDLPVRKLRERHDSQDQARGL